MSEKITNIDSKRPHYVGSALCRNCFHAWVATFPVNANILKLECPKCSIQKSFVSFFPDAYLEEVQNGG